jgi:peptidoglycan/xylan/chitin deacetylase (PgdA/CDA1 family)
VYYKGPGKIKKIALTFDDGPDTKITSQILDILQKEKVHATFFVVGSRIKQNPYIFKRIIREGHLIANHTWDHPILTKLTKQQIILQLEKTNNLIEQLSGKKPLLFRPPYGAMNQRVQKIIQEKGLTTVQLTIDTRDWQGPSPRKILNNISSQLIPGSIILQHSAGGTKKLVSIVSALPEIIHLLKKSNYQIVTLDQLLHTTAYQD